LDGIEGLVTANHVEITQEAYAPWRNLGGVDLLGIGREKFSPEDLSKSAETCANLGIDGLVMIGDHDTLTDAARLDYLTPNTRIICAPSRTDVDVNL
jgi:6-phosphofructokinase